MPWPGDCSVKRWRVRIESSTVKRDQTRRLVFAFLAFNPFCKIATFPFAFLHVSLLRAAEYIALIMMLTQSSSTSRSLFEPTNLLGPDPLQTPSQSDDPSSLRDDGNDLEEERHIRQARRGVESPPSSMDEEPSDFEDEMKAMTEQGQNRAPGFVSNGLLDIEDYRQRGDADSGPPVGESRTLERSNFSLLIRHSFPECTHPASRAQPRSTPSFYERT